MKRDVVGLDASAKHGVYVEGGGAGLWHAQLVRPPPVAEQLEGRGMLDRS